MTDETKPEELDIKAPAPRDRQPSPLLVRTGLALLSGERSLGGAMRRAGYAKTTSFSPLHSGHVTVVKALQAARRAQGEELDTTRARDVGLRTVLELAEDRGEPGGTRGAAAKVLLDYAAAQGLEPDPIGRVDWLRSYMKGARRLIAALSLALERPDLAVRYRDKLERRIAGWAAEYDLVGPTERAVRSCPSTRRDS